MLKMSRIFYVFRYIPRPFRVCLVIIPIVCAAIFLISSNYSSNYSLNTYEEIIDDHVNDFGLFDDDDMPLVCPSEIKFQQTNRQHLAIIIASELLPFIWKNFRALLCAGVNAYVMLDEAFLINSSSRADGFERRTNRSRRSYSRRFLFVTDQQLEKFGVKYMKKLPRMEFTSWDRAVVWLYHRINLTNVWILEHDVQWFDVRNLTYIFDGFVNDTTDLLCDNILETNANWGQWPGTQSDIFPRAKWIGTFSPLVRWSRRLLQRHYRYMQLIHKDRLKYEIDTDFRFQEFIMGTIAKTENLTIGLYNTNYKFIHIVLERMSDKSILNHLRNGKYILHTVKHDSILTNHTVEELTIMMKMNSLTLPNMTLLEKEKIQQ